MVASSGEKADLVKLRPSFFRAPRQPELVDLPEASYLVVDGEGVPGGEVFQEAIAGLYGVAYGVKMALKGAGRDFKVPTFGASWWFDSPEGELPRDQWRWQILMMVPDFVTQEDVAKARQALARKKGQPEPPVHLERIVQGLCVQAMHIGPYDAEQETIDRMEALMTEHRLRRRGSHHEVYLGDPRRAKPEALRTLLRLPVEAIA